MMTTSIADRTVGMLGPKMLVFVVLLIVAPLLKFPVQGFNLENRLPIIKYGEKEAYFGYSVAEHVVEDEETGATSKWILVGAPLGQNLQPETNHSGALYKCPITQRTNDCTQIITDGRRSFESTTDPKIEPPLFDEEIKDGQWLGVTVKSQGYGKALVCAHRYIGKERESQYGRGLCYVLDNELNFDDVYEPCKGRSTARGHEDYGYCQAGTSAALLDGDVMVLGTPGPYTWRGTIYITEIGKDYLKRDKNMYYSDHSEKNSPVDKYSYLGMAVTGGKYFRDEVAYAAGAPRSKGHGEVIIFSKSKQNPIPTIMTIKGEQFASSFGYELATADVNGDGYADLLVAAPFYFSKNEGGAVYVFQNEKYKLPTKATLKLTGKPESRFGLALANIGDINKDKCDDIAIGAPYEGDGVVYIYLGSNQGLSQKPSQVITSSDLGLKPNNILTFGISISGGIDLDGNSYPDTVIGAYKSSAVVALLARPITNIRTSIITRELENIDPNKKGCKSDPSSNTTCFSFGTCCAIKPIENSATKTLDLIYTIEVETFANMKKFSRVFFEYDNKRTNILKRRLKVQTDGRDLCTEETAYIKETTRDIQTPIKFKMSYEIVEPKLPDSGLNYLNPILDQTQAQRTFEGVFLKDCGGKDICVSELKLHSWIDLDKHDDEYAFNLGESDELRLNIQISNNADSAYEAQLFIVHQSSVAYIATGKNSTIKCDQFNETVVACNLGNPMHRGASVPISVRFDPSGLADTEKKLSFRVFANSTSELSGTKPDEKLDVQVVRKADLSMHGWASPEQSFYGGDVKGESAMEFLEDIGTVVTHKYQIYNDGPWKASHIIVRIKWPHQVANDKKQGKWLLYLEGIPTIEGSRFGQCVVDQQYVNTLNLTEKPQPEQQEMRQLNPEPYMYRPSNKSSSYSYYSEKRSSFSKFDSSNGTSRSSSESSFSSSMNRIRREIAKIIRAERLVDKDGKKTNVVTMDCDRGTAFCVDIVCNFYNMPRKSEVYINVKARLWNGTLVADYPRVDEVKIISRAKIEIPGESSTEDRPNYSVAVETQAYPELLDQVRDTSTPIWVIILGVVAGLLVLAILAFVLWKCGFFKRRRPDPMLSGSLKKNTDPENKPFL